MQLPIGTRLGQHSEYEIRAFLGQGGFGITYCAYDWHFHCHRAIKELLPREIAHRHPDGQVGATSEKLEHIWEGTKQLFQREAQVLASFNHPAIVKVHKLLEQKNTLYIVMDHIEGSTLEQILADNGPATSTWVVLDFLGRILEGLSIVHSLNFQHLDIKPQNILVDSRGTPILIDFGAARQSYGEMSKTNEGIVSHGYSALELYSDRAKVGPWTDIYSLGALVHKMIIGVPPPSSADRANEDEIYQPLATRSGLHRFDPEFLKAVDWALQLKRDHRPRTIDEWRMALGNSGRSRFESGKGVGAGSGKLEDKQHKKGDKPPIALIVALLGMILLGVALVVGAYLLNQENIRHATASTIPPVAFASPAPPPAARGTPPLAPTPAPAPISPPTPIPTPATPPALQTPTPEPPLGIEDFWNAYSQSILSTQTSTPEYDASFFADPCDFYQYTGGPARRATIGEDREKLYQDYPSRHVSNLEILDAVQTGPEDHRITYRFDFDYSGRRRSRGWTKVTIGVSLVGGGWLITSFAEKVTRYPAP